MKKRYGLSMVWKMTIATMLLLLVPIFIICIIYIQMYQKTSMETADGKLASVLGSKNAAVFLALEDGVAAAFSQCSLRHDYVEGTQSSPVGYLEGLYVSPCHRGKGLARGLLAQCEAWAAARGCREFASDCELANTASLAFHMKTGFSEANRIICFTKELKG